MLMSMKTRRVFVDSTENNHVSGYDVYAQNAMFSSGQTHKDLYL